MIAFITDLHFGIKGGNKVYFEEQMNFFEKQFFPYLIENDIAEVYCCGDVFDDRQKVEWFILQELKERFFGFFERNGILFHTLVGNHDMTFKNTLSHHAFKVHFNEFNCCKYYDTPTVVESGKYMIAMVPWMLEDKTLPKADIVCLHSELRGFSYVKGIECKNGLEQSELKDYKIVFNGHLHIGKREKNICNIGNPYQKDFGDFGEKKGFYTLDDNYGLTFIENTISPRHIKLTYSEKDGIVLYDDVVKTITAAEAVEICTNNHVKVITKDVEKQSKFDKFHQSLLASAKYKVEVIDTKDVVEDDSLENIEQSILQDAGVLDVTKGYVEGMTHPEGIIQDKLMTQMEELYQEALLEMV